MLARILVAAALGFSVALPSGVLAVPANGTAPELRAQLTCETSGASPSTADAKAAALHIAGLAQSCCVLNGVGSHCSTMFTTGSAAVGICGTFGVCVTCASAGNTLFSIASNCDSGGKAGGQSPVANGARVILFHS